MSETAKPNPGVAAVLSFVFSGLGQIYNGEIKKGLLLIALSTVSMLAIIIGAVLIGYWLRFPFTNKQGLFIGIALFLSGIIVVMVVGIYSIFDAYKVANKS